MNPGTSIAASPPAHALPAWLEKALLVFAMGVFAAGGYHLLGVSTDLGRARDFGTALDAAIPFVPASVHGYAVVYTGLFYPVFVVRDRLLFRRVVLAYGLVIAVSFLVFAAIPVTSAAMRPAADSLDARDFSTWALRLIFTFDPPDNLFPSLHLSVGYLAAASAWRARRLWGALAVPGVAIIAVTICTTKQHFLADGVSALALAIVADRWILRPWRGDGTPAAHGWGAPAGFLALHAAMYAAVYGAFRAGWIPWG